jgi:hypothetical protein
VSARVELPPLPPSVAVLPFLFMAPQEKDPDWDFQAALATAAAAELADTDKRNTLRRVAWLLCELGCQYRRRTGDSEGAFPLPRTELARQLGLGLSRVKRILALLTLSGVIASDAQQVRVLDWRRLSAAACYDPQRLGRGDGTETEEDDPILVRQDEEERTEPRLTASGDPACFV